MPSVYLSPSTQEYNRTIVGNSEEYYMNLITDAMLPYLQASGIRYGRNDPSMTALEAARQANGGDYDFFLSIHSNAAPEPNSGTVRGAEIYYYPESEEGRRAATIFANNYEQIYPLPENIKIIPLATLIELNKTRMPAILFELAYHDNLRDFLWLSSNIAEIGRNLALSLADYFGVDFVEPFPFARGVVEISGGRLNVRSAPSINSEIIGYLNNGDLVEIMRLENNWYEIRKGNLNGFANAEFIREL